MQAQTQRAARPAGPIDTPLTPAAPLARGPTPPAVAPAARPAALGREAAARKTVPAFNVAWADLDAAVQAGWIRQEAAHALWARWLARKPLTHVDDDGGPQTPLPPLPLPPEGGAASESAGPQADTDERPAPLPPAAPSPAPAATATAASAAPPAAQEPPGAPPQALADRPPAASLPPDHAAEPPPATDPSPAPQASEAAAPVPPPAAQPEVIDVEVLEPLEDAQARRTAERAAQPAPVIQVTDVIHALPAKSARPPAPGWIVGQCLIAVLAGAVAAVSAGLGHVLFGPFGAALAAVFWAVMVWRKTVRFHAEGQGVRALLGAHLVLPLLVIAVWQVQEAAGWWPPAKPLDMFADPPLGTLAGAAPGLHLDWRWMALAGVPLAAAVHWLIRLRRPAMLAVVITLLWVVTFQAVAGVLQAMGLAFHGMTAFMLLLGGMTLLGGFYIDLKARPAGLADFARWPYLSGAALLGAGWLSLSAVPGPLALGLARYAAWLFFLVAALSVSRPSLVALALSIAGLEGALGVGAMAGSSGVTAGVWLVWLMLVAGLLVWMFPRAHGWARRWQFWMPRAWREALTRPPG